MSIAPDDRPSGAEPPVTYWRRPSEWLRALLMVAAWLGTLWYFLGSPIPWTDSGAVAFAFGFGLVELVRAVSFIRAGESARSVVTAAAIGLTLICGALWFADGWRPIAAGTVVFGTLNLFLYIWRGSWRPSR